MQNSANATTKSHSFSHCCSCTNPSEAPVNDMTSNEALIENEPPSTGAEVTVETIADETPSSSCLPSSPTVEKATTAEDSAEPLLFSSIDNQNGNVETTSDDPPQVAEDSMFRDNSDRIPIDDNSYRGFSYRFRRGSVMEDEYQIARLIRRDLPFSQSRNRVHVGHNHGWKIYRLLRYDWFHVILRYPPGLSLLCLLSIWTVFVLIFAGFYVEVDSRDPNVDCGLGLVGDPIAYGQAFSFSLETTTTGM
jgi:hypothetical protein